MARCFEDGAYDQERWDTSEKRKYAEQIKKLGITTLIANYLADPSMSGGSFGGAFAFDRMGNDLRSYPLGKPGILLTDINSPF